MQLRTISSRAVMVLEEPGQPVGDIGSRRTT